MARAGGIHTNPNIVNRWPLLDSNDIIGASSQGYGIDPGKIERDFNTVRWKRSNRECTGCSQQRPRDTTRAQHSTVRIYLGDC